MGEVHQKYVEDLTTLANANAKASSDDVLSGLQKVGTLADGNLRKFVGLLTGARKGMIMMIAKGFTPRFEEAKTLGKEFGATKV